MRLLSSMVIAFATYSRIPMPQVAWTDENRTYSMCFFPLIGAVIGALLAFWLWICEKLSIGALLQGALGALIPLVVTGGIHMDGLMDTSDALSSWQSPQRRLEILKDSHVGAFAVMKSAAYLLLFASLMSEAGNANAPLLAMVFVASRAVSAISSVVMKSAKKDGMLRSFTQNAQRRAVVLAGAGYMVACLLVWSLASIIIACLCAVVLLVCVLGYRRMAYRQFGGVTGDLAGYLLQMTELALTATLVIGGKLL